MKRKIHKGFSLIEVLLAITIFVMSVTVYISVMIYGQQSTKISGKQARAMLLAEEGMEAINNIRDDEFTLLTEGTYGLAISNDEWVLSGSGETIDIYRRSVSIENVDDETKNITVSVEWQQTPQRKSLVELDTVMTNWVSPPGTQPVDLPGGNSDWCHPSMSMTEYDLPGNADRKTIAAVPGIIYLGTGGDPSAVDFMKVTVDQEDPPNITVEGEFDENYSANDMWGDDSYVYLATTEDTKEATIVDITSLPYSETGYFDVPYYSWSWLYESRSIFESEDVGFVTHGRRIYSFDLSSKMGQRPQYDYIQLSNWWTWSSYVSQIEIVGDYMYTALYNNWYEIAILDISNPNDLDVTSYTDTNDEQVSDLFVREDGNRTYFGTTEHPNQDEFFILNTESKSGQRPIIASVDTEGTSINGITVVPGRAILVGDGGEEYQVYDINDEVNAYKCGGMEINSGIEDVASVVEPDEDVFSYIVTGDVNAELKIIQGGYALTGEKPDEIIIVREN